MRQEQINLDDIKEKLSGKVKFIPLILVLLIIFFGSFYIIETGQVGVKVRLGKYDMEEVGPGLHFKWPLIERVKKVDVRVRTINYTKTPPKKEIEGREGVLYGSPISVLDKRGLTVAVELTVQYQLRPWRRKCSPTTETTTRSSSFIPSCVTPSATS